MHASRRPDQVLRRAEGMVPQFGEILSIEAGGAGSVVPMAGNIEEFKFVFGLAFRLASA